MANAGVCDFFLSGKGTDIIYTSHDSFSFKGPNIEGSLQTHLHARNNTAIILTICIHNSRSDNSLLLNTQLGLNKSVLS